MSINQEIEYKQLLTKAQYHELKKVYFNSEQPFTQTNHYIDTPHFSLAKALMALRIREKEQTYEMTLKIPAEVGLTEYNHVSNIVPKQNQHILASDLPEDIKTVLNNHRIDTNDLHVLGALTTHRLEVEIDEGLLVLDHSEYLGTEDYELEFEVQDPKKGLEKFQDILNTYDIESYKPKNKVARFFEEKSK